MNVGRYFIKSSLFFITLLTIALLISSCGEGYLISYPPFVVATEPADGATKVPVTSTISVSFSEKMNPESIEPSDFQINDGMTGTITYGGVTATFTPSEPFDYDSTYTVVVSSNVEDEVGRKMQQNYTFSFSTVGPPPLITDFEPKSGYEGTQVTIYGDHFGESIEAVIVKINNVRTHLVSVSQKELVVEIPRSAMSGYLTVYSSGESVDTPEPFTILYHGTIWNSFPSGCDMDLNDIVYSGENYVVVGNSGTLLTSPDALNWTKRYTDCNQHLYGISFSGGIYVAVGAGGKLLSSTDLENWSICSWNPEISFFDVCWSGSRFVAVGSMGKIVESMDGYLWSESSSITSNWLYSIIRAEERYVSVGAGGTILIATSLNSWYQQINNSSSHLLDVAWSDSLLVAVGYDGVVALVPITGGRSVVGNIFDKHLLGIGGEMARMVAVGVEGTIAISFDHGRNWEDRVSGTTLDLNEVIWDGERYIAIGENGIVFISD